jgi:hypothetical protein
MPERASPADRRGGPLRARTRSRSPNPRSTKRGPRYAPVVIWRRLAASRSKASPSAPADARCPNAASARERESRRLSARRDGINVHMLPPDRRGRASWRGAGVAERGGLENRCTLCGVPWVRIPPPPPVRMIIYCIGRIFHDRPCRNPLFTPHYSANVSRARPASINFEQLTQGAAPHRSARHRARASHLRSYPLEAPQTRRPGDRLRATHRPAPIRPNSLSRIPACALHPHERRVERLPWQRAADVRPR